MKKAKLAKFYYDPFIVRLLLLFYVWGLCFLLLKHVGFNSSIVYTPRNAKTLANFGYQEGKLGHLSGVSIHSSLWQNRSPYGFQNSTQTENLDGGLFENWPYLLSLLLGGILVSLSFSRQQYLERTISEMRKKEVEYLHAMSNQKSALLRARIHPHFLSNSMSAIGSYILVQSPLKAYQYLQNFSKLMREVLEKASEPFLSLEEELLMLDAFLESLALPLAEGKLKWNFNIDPSLDRSMTLLPTMVLQPFVENAVEHGIKPKKGGGTIEIKIKEVEGFIICTIEDDGVGRRDKKEGTKGGHQSLSTTITKERVQLLGETEGVDVDLGIFDLRDAQGKAKGTRVVMKLPLILAVTT